MNFLTALFELSLISLLRASAAGPLQSQSQAKSSTPLKMERDYNAEEVLKIIQSTIKVQEYLHPIFGPSRVGKSWGVESKMDLNFFQNASAEDFKGFLASDSGKEAFIRNNATAILFHVIQGQNSDVVDELIKLGVPLTERDSKSGLSPMEYLILQTDYPDNGLKLIQDKLEKAIGKGSTVLGIENADDLFKHVASYGSRSKLNFLVELLKIKRFDLIRHAFNDKSFLIHWAAARGNAEFLDGLLKLPGADPNQVLPKHVPFFGDVFDTESWSPLMLAAASRNPEAVKVILRQPQVEMTYIVYYKDSDRFFSARNLVHLLPKSEAAGILNLLKPTSQRDQQTLDIWRQDCQEDDFLSAIANGRSRKCRLAHLWHALIPVNEEIVAAATIHLDYLDFQEIVREWFTDVQDGSISHRAQCGRIWEALKTAKDGSVSGLTWKIILLANHAGIVYSWALDDDTPWIKVLEGDESITGYLKRALLLSGKVHYRNPVGTSNLQPWLLAINSANAPICKLFLKAPVEVRPDFSTCYDIGGEKGGGKYESSLHIAIWKRWPNCGDQKAVVEGLVKAAPELLDQVSARTYFFETKPSNLALKGNWRLNWTPLMYAVGLGLKDLEEFLLAKGADEELKNRVGLSVELLRKQIAKGLIVGPDGGSGGVSGHSGDSGSSGGSGEPSDGGKDSGKESGNGGAKAKKSKALKVSMGNQNDLAVEITYRELVSQFPKMVESLNDFYMKRLEKKIRSDLITSLRAYL